MQDTTRHEQQCMDSIVCYLKNGQEDVPSILRSQCTDGKPVKRVMFGIMRAEVESVLSELFSAQHNDRTTLFPDFVTTNGFIEHFCITSTREGKKGSAQQQAKAQRARDIRDAAEDNCTQWPRIASDLYTEKVLISQKPGVHTIEYLHNSFKRNWEQHEQKVKAYGGLKQFSAFLIEYSEFEILMGEQFDPSTPSRVYMGDYRSLEDMMHYRLSRDKVMLEWINDRATAVNYIIFRGWDALEIIDTRRIDVLAQMLPLPYVYDCTSYGWNDIITRIKK